MLGSLSIAALVLVTTYLYTKVRYKRFEQHGELPQLPNSLLLGHLGVLDRLTKNGPPDRHPDAMFSEMHKSLGGPPLMFVDLRPVNRPMVLISNYEIAEQVSRASKAFPTSVPKTDLRHIMPLTGPTSILVSQDEKWRVLRKRYNPAFAPQHLMTLLPCVLDKTATFVQRLDTLAQTGEEFSLVTLAINLTFDIIGAVVMDADLEAQPLDLAHQGEIVRLFVELFRTYWDDKADLPWWLIPLREIKRRRLSRRIDMLFKGIIRDKFSNLQARDDRQSRSVLSLSLKDAGALTPQLVDETCDQIKTFLLAGHDTTSITLSWVIFYLLRTPRALACLREELDTLLGADSDPEAIRTALLSPKGPEIVRHMSYVAAVIKETLRLHPPAATAGYTEHGTGFTVRTPEGKDYCLDGMIIYNCEGPIQRDPAVYGDSAESFVPERWLDEKKKDGSTTILAGAWRPFERGPRNCIGQDFAMIEISVIVAMIARRFDFTKVRLGEMIYDEKNSPVLDEYGMTRVKSQVYSTRQVNARPADGMRMKVKRTIQKDL